MNLKKIFYIVILSTLFIAIITTALRSIAKPKANNEFNLVLISIDTLRPDHMGVYGYPKNTTPNIDSWAREATVFTNVRTITPATYPSFVELMTGKSPLETKIFNNGIVGNDIFPGGKPLPPDVITLAQSLKKYKYITTAFVTNPALLATYSNLGVGFDNYFFGGLWGPSDSRESYYNFILSSLDWIKKNSSNKFFLWIHLLDPHAPYTPPQELSCKFGRNFCNYILTTGIEAIEEYRNNIQGLHKNPLDNNIVDVYKTLYDGSVAYSDALVGKILDTIKNLHIDNKTIIVLYADHGEGFDHNYYFTHSRMLYDSSIKIPLIIRIPSEGQGSKKIDKLIDNTEIMQTLLQLLNPKQQLSVKNTIFDPNFKEKQYVYSMNTELTSYSIENKRFKYIYTIDKHSNPIREELYDIQNDKNEEKNISKTNTENSKELKSKLLNYLKGYNLPKPIVAAPIKMSTDQSKVLDQLRKLGY